MQRCLGVARLLLETLFLGSEKSTARKISIYGLSAQSGAPNTLRIMDRVLAAEPAGCVARANAKLPLATSAIEASATRAGQGRPVRGSSHAMIVSCGFRRLRGS
jgi:hypothetical protein